MRADAGRLIARTRHGFVCANAGVDQSNAGGEEQAVLLPLDPDALRARPARAARLRGRDQRLVRPCLAHRPGRGRDRLRRARPARRLARAPGQRRPRSCTRPQIALADEVAAAADLVRGKDTGEPAVRLRGLERHVLADDGPGVAALLRPPEHDLFA